MTLSQGIILICWAIFLAFWFINWKNVKPTKEARSSIGKFRVIILVVVLILFLNHFIFQNRLNLPLCQMDNLGCHFHFYPTAPYHESSLQIISTMLAILGLVIAIVARIRLAGNWSATLDLKKGHTLITTGIYQYVRHPIYTGLLLMLFATMLVYLSILEILIFLFVFIMIIIRMKNEEELMTKTFPKEYLAYKRRTKKLIPFIY